MLEPSSPIYHFYPLSFSLDSEGKRQEWEAVVVLEFVDEKLLKWAESSIPKEQLTQEEQRRNQFGSILDFTYDAGNATDPSDLDSYWQQIYPRERVHLLLHRNPSLHLLLWSAFMQGTAHVSSSLVIVARTIGTDRQRQAATD